MKKKLTLIILASLLLLSASTSLEPLKRLTIVNKSGLPIAMRMNGITRGYFYYLQVPAGDREFPFEKTFTIHPDYYKTSLYYLEEWDPVVGYRCASKSRTLTVLSNYKVIVFECDRVPPNIGEPPFVYKYK